MALRLMNQTALGCLHQVCAVHPRENRLLKGQVWNEGGICSSQQTPVLHPSDVLSVG